MSCNGPFNNPSFSFRFLLLLFAFKSVLGDSYFLNDTSASYLCTGNGCDFWNPQIWVNGVLPVEGSDVYLWWREDMNASEHIQVNVYMEEVHMSNMEMKGNLILWITSSPLFQIDGNFLAYGVNSFSTQQIQIWNSTLLFRNFTLDGAEFVCADSSVTIQYFLGTNYSGISVGTQAVLECGYCNLDSLATSPSSLFIAYEAFFPNPTTLYGVVNITNLTIGSKVTVVNATFGNVTINTNAAMLASGFLEIGELHLEELSELLVMNASIYIAQDGGSFTTGPGAMTLAQCGEIRMGSPYGLIDAVNTEIQLYGNNYGSFTNIIFGSLIQNMPANTVELSVTDVTFMEPTNLLANITVYGSLKIEKSLSVLGYVRSRGAALYVYGQLACYDYSHVQGTLYLYGALNAPSITVNNSTLNVLENAQVQGHVKVSNSSVYLSQSLFVKGGWESDNTAQIYLGNINPDADVRLNISFNVILNGTTFYYSISSIPSATTEYRLFAYHGMLNGTFQLYYTSLPTGMDASLFTMQTGPTVVSVIYTPSTSHHDPLITPGPWLWAVLGGLALLVILVVMASWYFIRRRKTRHYEVIQS